MKGNLFVLFLLAVVVLVVVACTPEELAEWEKMVFGSPITHNEAQPTPTPVCHPEFKMKDGSVFEFEWNCE